MLRYTDMMSVDAPLILGVRLLPFSLGHVLHMQEHDCIFLSPLKKRLLAGDNPKENVALLHIITVEMLLATTICSMTYEEFQDLQDNKLCIRNHPLFPKYITFQKYLSKRNKAFEKLIAGKHVNILESVNLFNRYLERGYTEPYYDDINSGEQTGASFNWPHTLIHTLCNEMTVTKSEVLNQPLNVTLLDYFKIAENKGCIHLQNDMETEMALAAVKGTNG